MHRSYYIVYLYSLQWNNSPCGVLIFHRFEIYLLFKRTISSDGHVCQTEKLSAFSVDNSMETFHWNEQNSFTITIELQLEQSFISWNFHSYNCSHTIYFEIIYKATIHLHNTILSWILYFKFLKLSISSRNTQSIVNHVICSRFGMIIFFKGKLILLTCIIWDSI